MTRVEAKQNLINLGVAEPTDEQVTNIQFEICEDNLKDKKYFDAVMDKAQELCAYLVKKFSLNIENVVCHAEAYQRGYASNHGDILHWLKLYNKSMDWFRSEVQRKLGAVPVTSKPQKEEKPKQEIYVVKAGDYLRKIAKNYPNVSWTEIATLNNISAPYIIRVGQQLKIPIK